MGYIRRITSRDIDVTVGPWDLTVTYSCYSDSGNTSGPIDRCYPPEDEMNIEAIKFSGEDVERHLAEEVIGSIEVECWEDARATWGNEDDERADFEFDAARERRIFG